MKILLIYPIDREFMPPSIFPLGIGYIASVLLAHSHDVKILDMNGDKENAEERLKNTLCKETYDWIGISSIITQYKKVKNLSAQIKALAPKTTIVLGGPGPTSHPILYISKTCADILVLGEGEETVVELCEVLSEKRKLDSCKGICINKSKEPYFTAVRSPIENLDSIPFPAWEHFPILEYMEHFLFKPPGIKKGLNILTSRGCPGKCIYCMRNFGNRVRYRSAVNILQEIEILHHRYGVNHFHFIDDTIASDRGRLAEISDLLLEKEVSITWSGNARVTQVTPALLAKLHASGCISLAYGIESGSLKILKEMKKGITPEIASKAIQWTRDAGINVTAYFMIGFPSENAKTISESVEFCKTNLVGGEFFFVTPFPSTEIYEFALEKGLILDQDLYLQVAGEVRNFVVNCTNELDNETLFSLKEQAEEEIQSHLEKHGYKIKKSIREDPRQSILLNRNVMDRIKGNLPG